MLNGTGDTEGQVQFRRYRFTGLTYLTTQRIPTFFNNRTGYTEYTAEGICQFFQNLEVFRRTHTATAGHDDFRFFDINIVHVHLNHFYETIANVRISELNFNLVDMTLTTFLAFRHFKHVRTNGAHLRTMFRTDNFRQNVTAQSRTSPFYKTVGCAYGQNRTVGYNAVFHTTGNARCQIATVIGSADKDNIRFILGKEIGNNLGITVGIVSSQQRMFKYVNVITAVFHEALGFRCYVGTEKQGMNIFMQLIRYEAGLTN